MAIQEDFTKYEKCIFESKCISDDTSALPASFDGEIRFFMRF